MYLKRQLIFFGRSQWVDLKTYLPGSVLEKVDRCSMANSLETRCPFLSKNFVEKIFSFPIEITNPSGKYKHLLRKPSERISQILSLMELKKGLVILKKCGKNSLILIMLGLRSTLLNKNGVNNPCLCFGIPEPVLN